MSTQNIQPAQLSAQTLARFDREVAKYPAEQKQSAVMACLSIVQQEQGWVSPEAELAVAQHLGMAPMAVHEVTTFYNMYNQQPVGKFKINVCTNLPCQLRDGGKALAHLRELVLDDGHEVVLEQPGVRRLGIRLYVAGHHGVAPPADRDVQRRARAAGVGHAPGEPDALDEALRAAERRVALPD